MKIYEAKHFVYMILVICINFMHEDAVAYQWYSNQVTTLRDSPSEACQDLQDFHYRLTNGYYTFSNMSVNVSTVETAVGPFVSATCSWAYLCKFGSTCSGTNYGLFFLNRKGLPNPQYKITLSGGSEVKPSGGSTITTLPLMVTVKNQSNGQPPTTPVTVKISLKVDPTSGGHDHGDNTRPRGGIANVQTCPSDSKCWEKQTDGNGAVVFNFNAPEASGTHTITATCDGCSNTATKTVAVMVGGLETIPDSPFYTFIGETDKHTDNHYLTPEAASVLWRIAVSYQVEQQFKLQDPATGRFTVTPPVLHVNDASLKWGGLFDISGKWMSPHVEHRRGTVVDVRANNLDTAIPTQNFKEFKSLAADFGADAHFESPSVERRHVHLRLLSREE